MILDYSKVLIEKLLFNIIISIGMAKSASLGATDVAKYITLKSSYAMTGKPLNGKVMLLRFRVSALISYYFFYLFDLLCLGC